MRGHAEQGPCCSVRRAARQRQALAHSRTLPWHRAGHPATAATTTTTTTAAAARLLHHSKGFHSKAVASFKGSIDHSKCQKIPIFIGNREDRTPDLGMSLQYFSATRCQLRHVPRSVDDKTLIIKVRYFFAKCLSAPIRHSDVVRRHNIGAQYRCHFHGTYDALTSRTMPCQRGHVARPTERRATERAHAPTLPACIPHTTARPALMSGAAPRAQINTHQPLHTQPSQRDARTHAQRPAQQPSPGANAQRATQAPTSRLCLSAPACVCPNLSISAGMFAQRCTHLTGLLARADIDMPTMRTHPRA